MEYQRLLSEHTSFWSNFYKSQIPDAIFNAPFSWERRRHWKTEKGKEFSLEFQWTVSIDESLIDYEGRGPAIEYMPNKHHQCIVYVKVKVGIRTIFLFMRASKAQEVNVEIQMTFI